MITVKRVFLVVGLAMQLAVLGGCFAGNEGSVSGNVTVDGVPVNGLEVIYTPIDPSLGGEALAYTQDGGKYSLIRGRGNTTIPKGAYKVTISVFEVDPDAKIGKVKLGKQYTSLNETELKADVQAGQNSIDFDLKNSGS